MTKQLPKIRTKKPTFKIPSIIFSGIGGDMDISSVTKNNDFKNLIKGISYESIKFHKNEPFAKLFQIKNTKYCFNLERKSYKTFLKICLKDFEDNEDYEKCVECKELMSNL